MILVTAFGAYEVPALLAFKELEHFFYLEAGVAAEPLATFTEFH
jgi:hypothetical protein